MKIRDEATTTSLKRSRQNSDLNKRDTIGRTGRDESTSGFVDLPSGMFRLF
jgi:hypothetical protein